MNATGGIFSIDIGSTYTKGKAFRPANGALRIERHAQTPTTQDDLLRGFEAVREALGGTAETAVHVSSSAKGGLRIAAVGLVPDLTLKAAVTTACSAGGRVVASSSYGLTEKRLETLLAASPDLILLTGGSDGGDERHVRRNAERLAAAGLGERVLYAGNAHAAEAIDRIFAGRARIAANVMPEVGRFAPEPARAAIRGLFLERIADGRGLGRIRQATGRPVKPTPTALLDLMTLLAERGGGAWRGTGIVDIGGATTDVYSCIEPGASGADVVVRGLPEPLVKRTVEGNLGLRGSAAALIESADVSLRRWTRPSGIPFETIRHYATAIAASPARLPRSAEESQMDALLARACFTLALVRHAGREQTAYTAAGPVRVHRGGDLTGLRFVIGTGGALARSKRRDIIEFDAESRAPDDNGAPLLPERFAYCADTEYVAPHLGNLAAAYPDETIRLAERIWQRPARRAAVTERNTA